MMTLLLLFLCLCLCTSAAMTTSIVSSSSSVSSRTRRAQDKKTIADPSAAYALYSLPPFTVTFTSSYNVNGLPTDPTERSQLLTATLHSPLQLITAEFLVESFRIQIAKPEPNSNFLQGGTNDNNTEDHEANLYSILDSFMTLDLQVAVRQSDHLSLGTVNHDDGRRHSLRLLAEGEPREHFPAMTTTTTTSRAQEDNVQLLQFEADFFTTAAFLEPVQEGAKPTNKEVAELLGGWIDEAFDQDESIYKKDLINSETGVLQHLEQLHVQTDSGAVFDPYATGTVPIHDSPPPTNKDESPFGAPPNAASTKESTIGAWSPSEKLFFTMLVMVSILSIAGLLLALKKFRHRNKELARMMESEFSSPTNEFDHHTTLGGRHSDEIMDILNASDRYLAEHRPDLLEAMQLTEPSRRDNNTGRLVIPVANNPVDDDNSNRPIERRYVTVSNPFSYIYGASYFHSEKQAVERDRRRHPHTSAMEGVELQPESVPDDEDLDLHKPTDDHAVSGFLQTWFQQLVGKRTTTTTASDAECHEETGLVDADMDELVIEECITQETLACDEDPTSYDFAYQDFPRQDGTPCLIYEETLNDEEEEQFLRNSRRESLHSTTSYGVNDPLTDDEFQRALSSQHNAFGMLSNNSSFEREATDSSMIEFEDVDTNESNDSSETEDPSKFTDKLERLVAMRHRHYEKQRIVEKHREQRRQERARQRAEKQKKQQEEMEKRDLLLRRHSLELDIQELEAAVGTSSQGPPSSSSKVISPTDSQGSQTTGELRSLQKPNLHRRTSSEADAGLSPTMSAGIQSTLSMDIEDTTAASTRSDPPKRLVQSARKRLPPGKPSYNDVFRPIDQNSPLSTSSNCSNTLPPSNRQSPPIVSPASSMTETGTASAPSSAGDNTHSTSSSSTTPPLMMGSRSIRDGSSARKKQKRVISSASAALAKGFQARRSMSFGNLEEKKVEDDMHTINCDSSNSSKKVPPRRTYSNRHRRSGSNSPADVMVHGIYAQFAS